MCSFYENLYSSKHINDENISTYLQDVTCPKLNDQEKKFCDSLPTIDECTDAVNNLKNNKSPGLDGLPGEFYKCFWKTIKPLFYDVLLCVFEKQELPFSQRLALITL